MQPGRTHTKRGRRAKAERQSDHALNGSLGAIGVPWGEGARQLTVQRLLLGASTWAPFVAWVAWLLLDVRLDLDPWIAGVGVAVLVALWAIAARTRVGDGLWPMLGAAAVVFAVSYSVAARSAKVGGFIVVSTLGWTLANSVRGALVSVWAADLVGVHSYAQVEDSMLRNVMLGETALMTAIAVGRTGNELGGTAVAVLLGLLVGGILSWFVFALVYWVMNVALSLAYREEAG